MSLNQNKEDKLEELTKEIDAFWEETERRIDYVVSILNLLINKLVVSDIITVDKKDYEAITNCDMIFLNKKDEFLIDKEDYTEFLKEKNI